MDLRRPLAGLLAGLLVLVVAFAVLSGASSFSATVGDRVGALLLWRMAIVCLLLLLVDGFLLLAVLGWNALLEMEHDSPPKRGIDLSESPGRSTQRDTKHIDDIGRDDG